MSDNTMRDEIAEALPDSLNSQHRRVLADRILAALRAAAAEVSIPEFRTTKFCEGDIQRGIESGIAALRGDENG